MLWECGCVVEGTDIKASGEKREKRSSNYYRVVKK
jgi:hypothetical protein